MSTDQELNFWLDLLFDPRNLSIPERRYETASTGFMGLVNLFCTDIACENPKNLRFNEPAMLEMLARIARDAYGLAYLSEDLKRVAASNGIKEPVIEDIKCKIRNSLGIRVNSEIPRKTRIAAVYVLWMATMRPFFYDVADGDVKNGKAIKNFTASFIIWVATGFLEQWGTVDWGSSDSKHDMTRLWHVTHDLKYRDLSLSSLELLFCSVFRIDESNA